MVMALFIIVALGVAQPLLAAECAAGAAECAAQMKTSSGDSLLQSRRSLQRSGEQDDAARAGSAPQARNWLGWGRWVAKEDLWHMQTTHGESLFTDDLPDSCFQEADCRHAHGSKSVNFDSVESWSSYYSSYFGLSLSGSYGGFSGSLDASLQSSASNSGTVSKRMSYSVLSSQRKCYRLVRDDDCAYNEEYLQPEFKTRLEDLPRGEPFTAEKMEVWKHAFIQRFGTHLTTMSSHGALVQSLASVDARSELSSDCMSFSMGLQFGWIGVGARNISGSAGVNLSAGVDRCDNSNSSTNTDTSTCVVIGGDPAKQNDICQPEVSQEDMDSWLDGGNVDTGSTVFRYSFMPLTEFLTNINWEYYEVAMTLAKAVEYSNCRTSDTPPVYEWDGSGCKCVRQCQNGGTLDISTCTCQCPGDVKHGWTGPTCTEEYGSCQPGIGTGNKGAAAKCPVAGKCASWYSQHSCTASEVCCATNFGTTCCPFGNTCNCGARKCECVAN